MHRQHSLCSVNPNTGAPLTPDKNTPSIGALNTVYGTPAYPSAIVLPVITNPDTQLPKISIV